MRGALVTECDPPGMTVELEKFGCGIARRVGALRLLEAENPE
jgi:hypothetical protein